VKRGRRSDPSSRDAIASLAEPENFKALDESDRRALLGELTGKSDKEGGLMGRIFGTKKENASMYVALTLCLVVAGIGVLVYVMSGDMQIWSIVFPVITASLGYIFGKGTGGE